MRMWLINRVDFRLGSVHPFDAAIRQLEEALDGDIVRARCYSRPYAGSRGQKRRKKLHPPYF